MKLNTLWLFLLFSNFVKAQINTPDVIASSGGYFVQNNGSISWTLGEIVTEKSSNNTILTQGFQQSQFNVLSIRDVDGFLELNPFPNPVVDYFTIKTSETGKLRMDLFDMQGRLIESTFFYGNEENQFSMLKLSVGLYLVKISTENKSISKTFKIQKIRL